MRCAIAGWAAAFGFACLQAIAPATAQTRIAYLMRDAAASKRAGMTDQQMLDLAATLWAYGIEVIDVSRLNVDRLKEAQDEFEERLAGADLALLYYVGMATSGPATRIVMPGSDGAQQAAKARVDLLPLLQRMRERSRQSVVILDALKLRLQRNRAAASEAPGFNGLTAATDAGANQLVTYTNTFADTPGNEALPLSRALLRHLKAEGTGANLGLVRLASLVKEDVAFDTGGRSVPWVVGGLSDATALQPAEKAAERELRTSMLAALMKARRCIPAQAAGAARDQALRQPITVYLGQVGRPGSANVADVAFREMDEMYHRLRNARSCPFVQQAAAPPTPSGPARPQTSNPSPSQPPAQPRRQPAPSAGQGTPAPAPF